MALVFRVSSGCLLTWFCRLHVRRVSVVVLWLLLFGRAFPRVLLCCRDCPCIGRARIRWMARLYVVDGSDRELMGEENCCFVLSAVSRSGTGILFAAEVSDFMEWNGIVRSVRVVDRFDG